MDTFKIFFFFVMAILYPILVMGNTENLHHLKLLENSMDTTIDPCDNFYGYACGKWSENHVQDFSTNLGEFLQFNHTSKIMELIMRKYPERKIIGEAKQTILDKAALYMHSCLKEKNLNVLKYLEEIKPGPGLEWPLLGNSSLKGNWSEFDAFAFMGKLHSYGFNTDIIEQLTFRDNGNVLTVLTIPDAEDLDVEAMQLILQQMKIPSANIPRQLDELQKTHDYWVAAYKDYGDYGESENFFTYEDIKRDTPQLNTFLDYVIPKDRREPDSLVAIPFWDYMQFLLQRHWQPYENEKFCNYLMMKFLLFLKEANGPGCLISSQQRMHLAFDYLYYRHVYAKEVREINQDLANLTKIIHKTLLAIVYENHLNFNDSQVKAIRNILANVSINIGNLPENINLDSLEEFYRSVPLLNISNFYANDLALMKNRVLETWSCPDTMSCVEDLKSTPHNFFNSDLLVIPFASLRPPLYQRNLHPLLLLSSLGSLLAHELTHSIDSTTLKTDSLYDSLFANILQTPKVQEAMACMKFTKSNRHMDERIADLMGARVAFKAYSEIYNNTQPSFSAHPWNQLFFLSLGQIYCSNKPHVNKPGSQGMRLNQIAMNMDSFSEAFNCSSSSKMNPLKKCRFY
ncbi:endothelin-converting enzyme-like 1 [Haematobia irritans]|uniref:endothelin-converting enzyme-like 1 n=1 Tax=Haematobia irritans TaxID=7368 RepID=UPI003F50B727